MCRCLNLIGLLDSIVFIFLCIVVMLGGIRFSLVVEVVSCCRC